AGDGELSDEADLLAVARLTGAAVQVVARRRGVLGDCMIAVTGARPARIEEIIDALPESLRLHVGLRNGRDRLVVCGPEASLTAFTDHCAQLSEREAEDRAAKRTGGAPFTVETETLPIRAAFHHPDLAEVPSLVGEWAEQCGLDRAAAAELAHRAVVAPVDWV